MDGNGKAADFQIEEIVYPVERECGAEWHWSWEKRPWYGLVLIRRGRALFEFPEETVTAVKRDLVFLRPGDGYTLRAADPCGFAFTVIAFTLEGRLELPRLIPYRKGTPLAAFERISALFRTMGPYFEEKARAETALLLYTVAEAAEGGTEAGMRDAGEYIREHLAEPVTVTELAGMCGCGVTSFRERFERAWGCSPVRFRQRAQVEKACAMLKSGLYTREEIVSVCGFGTFANFYRLFRRETGRTPGTYENGGLYIE